MNFDEFYSSGGGYGVCYYYGDPSGIYMNEEWTPGKALLQDGSELEGSFRYNVYKQKMEGIVDSDTFAFAKPCELDMLMIGESKFVYSSFVRYTGEVSNTWFEVLSEGNCSLLLRRFIKYRVSDGDDDITNDKLYRLEEYFVTIGDGELQRLYADKKSVIKTLQDHETEIAQYIKSNRLKMQYRPHLLELIGYYNTLE